MFPLSIPLFIFYSTPSCPLVYAMCQHCGNTVLAGVNNCSTYLYDLIIYTDTWEEHLHLLTPVLDHLAQASLTLNVAKCEFGKATLTYLGKQVVQGQIRPVEAKVAAVSACAVPTTHKALRSFLDGYYRGLGFCRNFSTVVQQLTQMAYNV